MSGRGLPGMPLHMPELDELDELTPAGSRRSAGAPWWRPQTRFGRILLGAGACVALGILAFAYYKAKTFLERDGRFRIASSNNIAATGLNEVSRADLLPVFGEDIGRNIFFVPLEERRKQLEQIPWIQSATVMRLLPDGIKIAIVERTPVAFVHQGQQIELVDANGVLLDMPAASLARRHYSFPVVSGIDPSDTADVRKARMLTYTRLVADLDSTGQHYSNQISEVDLSDPEDAKLTLPAQGADVVAHFGDNDFLARYERYKSHIGEWRQQYPQIAQVDLRYGQQVVLEMTHGAAQAAMPAEPVTPGAAASVAPDAAAPHKPSAAIVQKKQEKPATAAHTATGGAKTATAQAKASAKVVPAAAHSNPSHAATKPAGASNAHKASANGHATPRQSAHAHEVESRAQLMRERREQQRRTALKKSKGKTATKTKKQTSHQGK